ncbi:Glycine cleavage system transcriptional activator [Paraburkholderia fynbosensis]|uniref:Glycine cleavage system transcriptional activator n=1 Tax=Paraburkholderia fynbosensis TaxID=1200993 RepID=A0A6J5GNP9_9BURK|nr:Glycine cleavage system transcriptional activator [Paraburkholderia fynbosensis]
MRRKIPTLGALIAFEAAARHESFSRAASELALTEGAISRQISQLEDYLGLPLFNRVKKRLTLTATGRTYATKVREDLSRIERNTIAAMIPQDVNKVVELAVMPTFSAKWLIPRLGEFQQIHPDITVNLNERPHPFLFGDSHLDAAVHFEHPSWAGTVQVHLFEEELVPVCAPTLKNIEQCEKAVDLASFTLLHKTSREEAWPRWFEAANARRDFDFLRGPRYDLFSMLIAGALSGVGVALVPRLYVQQEIADGRLIIPVDKSIRGLKRYCLVYPEHKEMSPSLRLLADYLLECAAQARDASCAMSLDTESENVSGK